MTPFLSLLQISDRDFSTRIYNLSLVRMVATASILLCHFFQYFNHVSQVSLWLNTGVDIFLILSGYLYGMRSFCFTSNKDRTLFALQFYCKEFLKLLIPYYLMLSLVMPFYCLMGQASLVQVAKALLFTNANIPGFRHLWFFRFIIICYLGTPFWYFIPEKAWKNTLLLIVFIVMVLLAGTGIVWVACYVLGMLLARFHFFSCKSSGNQSVFNYLTIAIGGLLTIFCIMKKVDRTEYDFLLNTQKLFLGGSLFVLLTTLFRQDSFSLRMRRFLMISDTLSYEVFLVHPLFLSGAFCVMDATSFLLVNWLLLATCIAIASLCLHVIATPFRTFCYRCIKL